VDAATFHDFGKLDPLTQAQLGKGREARLTWDYMDGAWRICGPTARIWLRGLAVHHAPGLPSPPVHFPPKFIKDPSNYRRLRGVRRDDGVAAEKHRAQIEHTEDLLPVMHATLCIAAYGFLICERQTIPFRTPVRLSRDDG
jgi:CRISPR-associated endonuclease/helicase Cas3